MVRYLDHMTEVEKMLKDKKTIVFGERDDIAGKAISACLLAAGAEILYETTACFV
jgi:glycine reductase